MYFSYLGVSVIEVARTATPIDGRTDCTSQFEAMLASGRDISLQPGITYVVSRPLIMQAGQILYGNGATIKRAAQIATTTNSVISSGVTTSILVASTAGLELGMQLVLEKAGVYDTSSRTISAISGNTITVSTSFGISSASGAVNVYTSWPTLVATADDVHIIDLRIDGNRSQFPFARWEVTKEIEFGGDRNLFEGVRIEEAPGEAFVSIGTGDFITFSDCHVVNANGNGIHFGGNTHVVVDRCRFTSCTLDPNVGHSDGCVIWSNTISHATVSDCYMQAARSGIGSIDSSDNSHVTLTGNTIKDMTVTAIDMTCPDTDPANVVIVGNRIYDSIVVDINNTDTTPSVYPNHVIFNDNLLVNTKLNLRRLKQVVVVGNQIEDAGDTTALEIEIRVCSDVVVQGNVVVGGDRAVWIQDAGTENILVEGNIFRNQFRNGVRVETASLVGIAINHNEITNDSSADSTYDAILLRAGERAHGNEINIVKGHAGIYLQNGAIADDNIVRPGAATYSYRADGGTTGIICQNNYYTTTAPNNGGGGSNTFANNLLIT